MSQPKIWAKKKKEGKKANNIAGESGLTKERRNFQIGEKKKKERE